MGSVFLLCLHFDVVENAYFRCCGIRFPDHLSTAFVATFAKLSTMSEFTCDAQNVFVSLYDVNIVVVGTYRLEMK